MCLTDERSVIVYPPPPSPAVCIGLQSCYPQACNHLSRKQSSPNPSVTVITLVVLCPGLLIIATIITHSQYKHSPVRRLQQSVPVATCNILHMHFRTRGVFELFSCHRVIFIDCQQSRVIQRWIQRSGDISYCQNLILPPVNLSSVT